MRRTGAAIWSGVRQAAGVARRGCLALWKLLTGTILLPLFRVLWRVLTALIRLLGLDRLARVIVRGILRLGRALAAAWRWCAEHVKYINPFWWLWQIPWMPRLSIIDRQIFRGFILTFITASIMFVSIMVLFDMMNQLKFFLQAKTPFSLVAEMYGNKMFFQFTMISPAAALFAAIYTINKMARNNELIAVINSGMSIYRMTASMAIFGLVFSIFLVWFNDEVVFPAERRANQISDRIRHGENPNSKSVSDIRLWGQTGVFWKAKYYDDRRMELRDLLLLKLRKRVGEKLPAEMALNELVNRAVPVKSVTVRSNASGGADLVVRSVPDINSVRYLDDVRLLTPARYWLFRVEAASARYNKNRQGWDFQKGRIRYYDGPAERVIEFENRFFPLAEIPFDFERADTRVNGMTTGEARVHIRKLEKLGAAHRKELVEYYLKFSFPLVNAIIIIIGISFGGFSPRSVLVLSFFIAVLVYLLYYTFVALGLSLGKTGVLDPALGAWLGNIGFFALGAGLLVFRKT